MELGSGIAIAGVAIPAAAVAITAIKTFAIDRNAPVQRTGNGNGNGEMVLCKEHSGLVACLHAIEDNQTRQEKWLGEISQDVKSLLRMVPK